MRGSCFLGEPERGKRHLKIVLTEPNSAGRVVVVTVTTLRDSAVQDTSCVLREGDHPFIRHDSIIDFSAAVSLAALDILAKLHSGVFAPKPSLSGAVFDRVIGAARASRDVPPRIKSMLFSAI